MLIATLTLLALLAPEGAVAGPAKPPEGKVEASLKRHEGPFAKVLEDAKAAGKPVVIDFYTDWCGWCKVMDKEVFTDAAVVKECNEAFLFFKVNAEKGEGKDVAAKYGVDGFPTFVFVDGTGEELDRQIGYAPKDKFLPVLAEVRAGNHVKGLKAKLEKEPKDPVAHAKLGMKLAARGDEAAWDHLGKAIELDAKDENRSTVEARFWLALLELQRDHSVDTLAAFAKKYADSPSAVDAHRILVRIYRDQKDDDAQIASLEVLVKKAPDAETRNELAWALSTHGREVERALGLVDDALKDEPKNAAFLDTRAECLSRLGRHDEAVAAQQSAVDNLPKNVDPGYKAQYVDRLAEFTKKRDDAKR
jgi:thioredoxin-related protein